MLPQTFDFDHTHSHFKKLFYFTTSAALGEIISSPFERIKTILQSKPVFYTKSPFHYKEAHLVFKDICNVEGWQRLFYGIKASLDRQIFCNIFRFYGYYYALDYIFLNPDHEYRYFQAFFSCVVGTTLGNLFTHPSDVLRIRIQTEPIGVDKEKFIGSRAKFDALAKSYGGSPTKVLFSGLKLGLLYQNIHAIMELFLFFKIKGYFESIELFRSHYKINTLSILLTNTLTTLVAAPLEFLYTQEVVHMINKKPFNVPTFCSQTLKNQGIGAFYKGYLPLLYKTVMMNTTIATFLEYKLSNYHKAIAHRRVIDDELEYLDQQEKDRYR